MKPGDRVRINIPGHTFHGQKGIIRKRDDYREWPKGQVVWVIALDNFRAWVGVDETELELL
jgi:hypothetical protein